MKSASSRLEKRGADSQGEVTTEKGKAMTEEVSSHARLWVHLLTVAVIALLLPVTTPVPPTWANTREEPVSHGGTEVHVSSVGGQEVTAGHLDMFGLGSDDPCDGKNSQEVVASVKTAHHGVVTLRCGSPTWGFRHIEA